MSAEEKEYKLIPYESEDPEDQIHLSDMFISVWDSRKTIAIITFCFIVYGILLSLSATEQFTSSATMMPNIEQQTQLPSALQQFSGLLGGAAMQQGGAGNEISIILYTDIIYSTPAIYNLIYEEFYVPDLDKEVTLKEYMMEYQTASTIAKISGTFLRYTVHLPVTILSGVKDLITWVFSEKPTEANEFEETSQEALTKSNDAKVRLTLEEWGFMLNMKERIKTNHAKDTGLFSIEVLMPDPEVSAQVAESIINYLTAFIIDYRTERLVRNLNFIEDRYKEIEEEFLEAQKSLAVFRDRNVNIVTARARSEEQRLESEYQLKFDQFNGIVQQREDVRFKLMQETPVFKVLEPVSVPTTRSSPKRTLMVILYAGLGFVASLIYIYGKNRIWPMLVKRSS